MPNPFLNCCRGGSTIIHVHPRRRRAALPVLTIEALLFSTVVHSASSCCDLQYSLNLQVMCHTIRIHAAAGSSSLMLPPEYCHFHFTYPGYTATFLMGLSSSCTRKALGAAVQSGRLRKLPLSGSSFSLPITTIRRNEILSSQSEPPVSFYRQTRAIHLSKCSQR